MLLFEQFYASLFVPGQLSAQDCNALRQVLGGTTATAALRRAVRAVFRDSEVLSKVHIRISRGRQAVPPGQRSRGNRLSRSLRPIRALVAQGQGANRPWAAIPSVERALGIFLLAIARPRLRQVWRHRDDEDRFHPLPAGNAAAAEFDCRSLRTFLNRRP
jgi:hypothetical protein